jgi:excisionase family DNA binding protein
MPRNGSLHFGMAVTIRDYLSVADAAELLGIHRATMWRLAQRLNLRLYTVAGDRRLHLFRAADIRHLQSPRLLVDIPLKRTRDAISATPPPDRPE